MTSRRRLGAPQVLFLSFVAGAVPFSGLAARLRAGVDLRRQGSGTVSGTALYEVAGFGPLAVAGTLDVAKGALGPLLAGRRRPGLAALSAGCAISGHNWSPFLKGAGGRGISPALGATLATAPEGTVLLGLGLGVGRLLRQTGLACLVAVALLIPVLSRRRGWVGAGLGLCIGLPIVVKRLMGNRPPPGDRRQVLVTRLLFDRDPPGTEADMADRPSG
jgi:acyl phosphate:glycerol-3-phosphate acyltransferase